MATSRLERIGTIFTRTHNNDDLLKKLSLVLTNIEADYNVLKENEQKLENLTGAFMKCIQQTTAAHKQKLRALQEIHSTFKKQVKGLLSHGAMKPDDRPVWFDVYKAFPPKVEPKFARTKPEVKTIRQILYKEDIIRAKFHSKGHGISVNMLSPAGETQIKRLIQKHDELESEGVSEDEIIEKSVAGVANEARQTAVGSESSQKEKHIPKNPESVTAKVLAEADLKNIFKE